MQALKSLIKKILNKEDFYIAKQENDLIIVWKQVVSKAVSHNIKVIKFHHGNLYLKASSPVWRQEISLEATTIKNKMNKKLKEKKIKKIFFR